METKNLIVINIIVVVAVLGLVSILSVNSARDRAEDNISSVLTNYEMEEAFVDSCMEEGANRSYCTCAYDYIDSKLTDRELVQLALDVVDGDIPDIMIDAVIECLDLFEY